MPGNVKVSSSWKTVAAMHTRVGGSWKNVTEGYTKISGAWKAFFTSVVPLTAEYLVIAGGGGGGTSGYTGGGGGGAGGYRTATGLSLTVATNYTVTVGAGGGSGGTGSLGAGSAGGTGGNSVFSTITSAGGGGGAGGGSPIAYAGVAGGSGGGAAANASGGAGNTPSTSPSQGNNGGTGQTDGTSQASSGGGGGASAVGSNGTYGGVSIGYGGNGGAGTSSSITGTAVTRAGGGGGSAATNASGSAGAGGAGGGGAASITASVATAGTVNTGGGGGGGNTTGGSGAGGSGLVILKYPQEYDIRNGAGLSYTTSVVGSNKVTVFTAGTGNIQFASAVNSSFVLLETVTLTSAQASIEFANLNTKYGSSYQHLQIRMVGRTTRAVSEDGAPIMYFNSDTSSSYRSHYLVGTGSSVVSYDNGTNMGLGSYPGNSAGANQFLGSVIDILDPFETTKNKTIRVLAGLAGSFNSVRLNSAAWFSTSALTTITINANSGSWATGTRIAIYGLKGS